MILQRRIPFIDIISVSTNEVNLKNNNLATYSNNETKKVQH